MPVGGRLRVTAPAEALICGVLMHARIDLLLVMHAIQIRKGEIGREYCHVEGTDVNAT